MKKTILAILIAAALLVAGCEKDNEKEKAKGMTSKNTEEIIQNGSQMEKLSLIRRLASEGGERNADIIAKLMEDSDAEIIGNAAFYMGRTNSRKHIQSILNAAKTNDNKVKNMALGGLAKIVNESDSDILPFLYQALNSSDILVRLSAIEAIGNIQNTESTSILQETFKNETPSVKHQIAIALGKIGDKRSLPFLQEYLKEVNNMDFSQRNAGGSRTSPPHPSILKHSIESAIENINKK